MNDKIKEAFNAIHANENLKINTQAFIAQKTHNYTAHKAPNYRRIIPAAVTAVCAALAFFAGIKLYFTPTTHINIDINPSLDLGINYFDRVVSVSALNDDGKKLMETLDIKFSAYDEALRKILDNESVEALLSEDEIMTVTVIETNTAQSANILSAAKACASDYSNVHCHSASSEEASAAYALGLSCEKYRAFLELCALDPDITPEKVQGMSMRQIRELIAALRSENGNNELPPTTGGNGHHGNEHHGNGYGHEHG